MSKKKITEFISESLRDLHKHGIEAFENTIQDKKEGMGIFSRAEQKHIANEIAEEFLISFSKHIPHHGVPSPSLARELFDPARKVLSILEPHIDYEYLIFSHKILRESPFYGAPISPSLPVLLASEKYSRRVFESLGHMLSNSFVPDFRNFGDILLTTRNINPHFRIRPDSATEMFGVIVSQLHKTKHHEAIRDFVIAMDKNNSFIDYDYAKQIFPDFIFDKMKEVAKELPELESIFRGECLSIDPTKHKNAP